MKRMREYIRIPTVGFRRFCKQTQVLSLSICLAVISAVGLTSTIQIVTATDGHAQVRKYSNNWQTTAPGGNIDVVTRKSIILELREPYARALVADDKVADVVPLTDHSLYVVGKEVGATSLALLNEAKQVIASIDVNVIHDISDLKKKLHDNIPFARIQVDQANGRIVLSGTVPYTTDVKKALAIADQYAPKSVTNALGVRSTQQVMLEVRFVEATRSASRELGLGTRVRNRYFNSDIGGQANVVGDVVQSAALLSGVQPFGSLIARLLDNGSSADAIVRALEARGLARRLAEPNLVTMSGDKASFLAGGEFPFPVDSGDDKITIDFKQFGVALEFTPTVLKDGLINLRIEPEVSELDNSAGVRLANVQIPGLVVRRAQTTVELRDGQSFAIAGLLQHTNTRLSNQLPWIGQVPVLGTLFRSAQYQKRQTDLVIIVTPRLVRGVSPDQKMATPLDGAKPSSDLDYFLLSREERPKWKTLVDRNKNSYARTSGHIISLEQDGVLR